MVQKRRFNQDAYESSKFAVQKVVSVLQTNFTVKDFNETYDVDLHIIKDYKKITADVETRTIWKNGESFPFTTVHVPERKKKFIDDNFIYIIVNKELNDCIFVDGKSILKCPVVNIALTEKNDDNYEYEDLFFDVPISLFKRGFDNLNDFANNKFKKVEIENPSLW